MRRPRIWIGAVAFACGVVAGWREPSGPVLAAVAIAGLCSVAVRRAQVRLGGIALIAFSCGAAVASLHAARAAPVVAVVDRYPRCHVSGLVSQRTAIGTFVRLRRAICDGQVLPPGAEVVVRDDLGEIGSRIATTGWLTPLEVDGIDAVRRRAGAAASLDASSFRVRPPAGLVSRAALAIRASLRRATDDRSPVTAGLLRGLAIGETDRLPDASEDALRGAGLSHLVAVSGTNVTIVLTIVASVAGRISRRVRLGACAAALVLFVAVVGPDPSVLRAAAMGAVGLLAVVAGSRSTPLDALAVAIVCVLALWPQMIQSVGLHLSVAATAGICLWADRLQRRWRWGPRWLRAALAVTVSAQVAVAPLLVMVFGEISLTGVPANLLAAPAVAPATVIALAAAIVGLVSSAAARGLIALGAPFADWIGAVGGALGAHDWASASVAKPLGTVIALGIVFAVALGSARGRPAGRGPGAGPLLRS